MLLKQKHLKTLSFMSFLRLKFFNKNFVINGNTKNNSPSRVWVVININCHFSLKAPIEAVDSMGDKLIFETTNFF